MHKPTPHTYDVAGLPIRLGVPTLVTRSHGFLWFPTLTRFDNGDLLATMSVKADVHTRDALALRAWSFDGGATWSPAGPAMLYGDVSVALDSGDRLLLPYYLFPREGGMGAPCIRLPRGQHKIEVTEPGVTVTAWPRPDKPFAPEHGTRGFVFNGQSVRTRDGGFLTTLYGTFAGDERYSLVAAVSPDGYHWTIRAVIADAHCPLAGGEGPCEAALCRLKDGRLMSIFRMASNTPFGQVWSDDDGRTWTAPRAMANAFSVQPSLAVLKDGTLVLSGGRPSLYLWFDTRGDGQRWRRLNLEEHHNACHPDEAVNLPGQTTAYTEVVTLDDRSLLCIYDRIPRSWDAIPAGSRETNSVWAVRVEVGEEQ